jgi:hypothetical protein
LQSLGKSSVQHFYPGIVNNTVAPAASRWQEAREGEDEAANRGQPLNQSCAEDPKFCQGHVVSPSLLTTVIRAAANIGRIHIEQPQACEFGGCSAELFGSESQSEPTYRNRRCLNG